YRRQVDAESLTDADRESIGALLAQTAQRSDDRELKDAAGWLLAMNDLGTPRWTIDPRTGRAHPRPDATAHARP
ncbi:MAG: hypothetical protein MUE41_14770, partial [Gemmatimonadaceae bacterium]|nr:hypothetical protein [Gemmatimonadaceae bacterium]